VKTGTKSLLFGGHQFILHSVFVTAAWRLIYGTWPSIPVLLAIIVHDWGYWGCEKMDDAEGELHPVWAAKFLLKHFPYWCYYPSGPTNLPMRISYLAKYHSRFLAKRDKVRASPLCLPDKYGVALMPTWLWVLLTRLDGGLDEYMTQSKYEINQADDKETAEARKTGDPYKFFEKYKALCNKWITGEESLEPWYDN